MVGAILRAVLRVGFVAFLLGVGFWLCVGLGVYGWAQGWSGVRLCVVGFVGFLCGLILCALVAREVVFVGLWCLACVARVVVFPVVGVVLKIRPVALAVSFVIVSWAAFIFYTIVVIESVLERILSGAIGHHEPTNTAFSLVNGTDPSFGGFHAHPLTLNHNANERVIIQQGSNLALACKLSYEKYAIVHHEVTTTWGFERCCRLGSHHSSARGFVAENENIAIVSFAGTNPMNLKHIITDITAHMADTQTEFGKVHLGFVRALQLPSCAHLSHQPTHHSTLTRFKRVIKKTAAFLARADHTHWSRATPNHTNADPQASSEVQEFGFVRSGTYTEAEIEVLRAVSQGKRVFITGHSLGGALAIIFAAQLVLLHPHITNNIGGVFTFGAPKIGNGAHRMFLHGRLGNRIFRFVNNFDLVPRLPIWIPSPVRFVCSSLLLTSLQPQMHSDEWECAGRLFVMDSRGRVYERDGGLVEFHLALSQAVGVLSLHTIRKLRTESRGRVVARLLLPFFVNDHFPCDYVNTLRGAAM